MKIEFPGHIFENTEITNFMKIRLVRAELFHGGGRTDRQTYIPMEDVTKPIVVFLNFATRLKIELVGNVCLSVSLMAPVPRNCCTNVPNSR